MGPCAPLDDSYLQNCKLEELGIILLNPTNVLITTGLITKTGTLSMTFNKPVGGSKPVCSVCICPTEIFLTHLRKQFRINEL